MHDRDKAFIDNILLLFNVPLVYKISERTTRVKCVIKTPPKISKDVLLQILILKKCQLFVNMREQELIIHFYKHGSTISRKRSRENDIVQHPFKTDVRPEDKPVIDSLLNILCSVPHICKFDVKCELDAKCYNIVVRKIEEISFQVVENILNKLSMFVKDIFFDFANQSIILVVHCKDSIA